MAVGLLAAIGLAIVDFVLPATGLQLLLAPAVGLAVLGLAFQWVTLVAPAYLGAIAVLVVTLPLAAWTLWRRRTALFVEWRDLAGAAAIALVFFLALFQIDIQRGFFTLGGYPSDNVFIYVQAAQYLLDHAMPVLHGPVLSSPASAYLIRIGPAFPDSVGPIDAAISRIAHVPVYAVFDFVNAVSLSIAIGPVWLFVRRSLGGSWLTAAAAAAILATNQLVYWVIGNGFQQESMALPLFAAGLAVAALLVRAPSKRTAALLGLIVAALLGLYFPIAVLLVVCTLLCGLVAALWARTARLREFGLPIVAGAITVVVAGLPALYVLLAGGGLAIWQLQTGVRVAAGGVRNFPLLPYLLGDLPFAHGWLAGRLPFGLFDKAALPLYGLGSALILILLVLGTARAALRGRAVEATLLVAGMLFVFYEGAVAQYPYGYVKSIGYMAPMTSAFIAFGGIGIEALAPSRWFARAKRWGTVAVAVVVAASVFASFDMVRLWEYIPGLPTFPRSYVALASLAGPIPDGASVLVDYPTTDYLAIVKIAAITYFLPDRDVRVYVGDTRIGTFPSQEVWPRLCDYQYIISANPPGGGFVLVASFPEDSLNVYRRTPPCS